MSSYEEAVRHVAHLIWVEEGEPDGRDKEHWALAEQIFRAVDEAPAISTPATGPDDDSDTGGLVFPETPLSQKMPGAGKIVAILGIGALSATYVVILSALGFTIRLWADPAHRTQYNAMETAGTVNTASSVKGRFRVTFCGQLVDALRGAEMVFATTPTYALNPLFQSMKALYDGPLLSSASTFTSLFIVPACFESPGARLIFGRPETLSITEVSSATITAKWNSVTAMTEIKKMKESLEYATIGGAGGAADQFVEKIFVNPVLTRQDMLELFFNSPGSRVHQMGIVAGLTLVQQLYADANARYYRDIVGTAAVGDLLVRFETDLFRIAAVWGVTPKPLVQWFNDTYPPPADHPASPAWTSVGEWARWAGPHNNQSMIPNPTALGNHRFVMEDGRHSCRVEKLAKVANMDPADYACVTEVIEALSAIVGNDIRDSAGLADIGLVGNVTKAEFLALLN